MAKPIGGRGQRQAYARMFAVALVAVSPAQLAHASEGERFKVDFADAPLAEVVEFTERFSGEKIQAIDSPARLCIQTHGSLSAEDALEVISFALELQGLRFDRSQSPWRVVHHGSLLARKEPTCAFAWDVDGVSYGVLSELDDTWRRRGMQSDVRGKLLPGSVMVHPIQRKDLALFETMIREVPADKTAKRGGVLRRRDPMPSVSFTGENPREYVVSRKELLGSLLGCRYVGTNCIENSNVAVWESTGDTSRPYLILAIGDGTVPARLGIQQGEYLEKLDGRRVSAGDFEERLKDAIRSAKQFSLVRVKSGVRFEAHYTILDET